MNALIGLKTQQLQRFLEDGKRVPITVIRVPEVRVTQQKTLKKEGYTAVQLGVASTKESKLTKAVLGHVKKSGAHAPLFLSEIRITDETLPEVGSLLAAAEILEPGDIVQVTGKSKGKGFAGGVKRYGFRGGPRTHGQSDRERAPGSIGQTTTPGRVYKGKRMAGNMGNDQVTVKNLLVVSVDPKTNGVMIAGLVPGLIGSYVTVEKTGSKKKFIPLLKNEVELAEEAAETARLEAEAQKVQKEAEKQAQEAAAAQPEEASATDAEVVDAPVTAEQVEAAPTESEEPKEEKAS